MFMFFFKFSILPTIARDLFLVVILWKSLSVRPQAHYNSRNAECILIEFDTWRLYEK